MRTKTVYFIKPVGMAGPIKIGCSARPERRLEQLMLWSPFDLEIVATIDGDLKLERNLHECFAEEYRRQEWFDASDRLVSFVEKLKAGVPVGQAIDLTKRTSLGTVRRRPEFKRRMSYKHRLRWAAAKLGGLKRSYSWQTHVPPEDVVQIMDRWCGYRDGVGPVDQAEPTPAEIARLEEVLSQPALHFIASDFGKRMAARANAGEVNTAHKISEAA